MVPAQFPSVANGVANGAVSDLSVPRFVVPVPGRWNDPPQEQDVLTGYSGIRRVDVTELCLLRKGLISLF